MHRGPISNLQSAFCSSLFDIRSSPRLHVTPLPLTPVAESRHRSKVDGDETPPLQHPLGNVAAAVRGVDGVVGAELLGLRCG